MSGAAVDTKYGSAGCLGVAAVALQWRDGCGVWRNGEWAAGGVGGGGRDGGHVHQHAAVASAGTKRAGGSGVAAGGAGGGGAIAAIRVHAIGGSATPERG